MSYKYTDLVAEARRAQQHWQNCVNETIAMEHAIKQLMPHFPELPSNAWIYLDDVMDNIRIMLPWRKVEVDNYMLELQKHGWLLDSEVDDIKGAGEFSWYFSHPVTSVLKLRVVMRAKDQASLCVLEKIGTQIKETPIYRVICQEQEAVI